MCKKSAFICLSVWLVDSDRFRIHGGESEKELQIIIISFSASIHLSDLNASSFFVRFRSDLVKVQ